MNHGVSTFKIFDTSMGGWGSLSDQEKNIERKKRNTL